MLSEQSEFIKCFEKSWFRPLSSGRFRGVYSLLEKLEKERKADGAVVGALDVGVDEGVGEMGTETIGDDEIIDTPTGVLLTRLKTV